VGSWGFLPVFGRNGEIYDGYYTPKSGQLIAFVQVFTFAGATKSGFRTPNPYQPCAQSRR
ncbi:hypothetical protein, partial [Marinobacter sp. NFXS9]|uniref:hypothetical protein n=1 Tax=Marinobacter sp. NFXS9 TaxID=2818433 RepID=UPI0032DF4411